MAKTPKCRACKRRDGTHSKGCTRTPCVFCARFAPEKCKHHGGPSHGAADRGKVRAGKRRAATRPRAVRTVAERTPLAAGIARLKATIAAGRAAEAELAAIRAALEDEA